MYASVGEDIAPIADALRASGFNADAMRHFNERIAGGMDLRPLLERIEAPTLVLACERDPFAAAADETAVALPTPTVVTIPRADHFAFLDPEACPAWSRAVLDFLA